MKIETYNNRAFTLVEILVSISILAMVITPFLSLFVQSIQLNSSSQKKLEIANVVKSEMEKLKGDHYAAIMAKAGISSYSIGPYLVDRTIEPYYGEENNNYDVDIIEKGADGTDEAAYIITPSGPPEVKMVLDGQSLGMLFYLSGEASHISYGLIQTINGKDNIEGNAVLSEKNQEAAALVLNFYLGEKPNTYPFEIHLEDYHEYGRLKVFLWDDYYHQNEVKLFYKDAAGILQTVLIPKDLSIQETGGSLPFPIHYQNTNTRNSSWIKTKIQITEPEDPLTVLEERMSIFAVKH